MLIGSTIKDLIFDWGEYSFPSLPISVFDTTLRDGLQSPQIKKQPTLVEKVEFLAMAEEIGIDAIEIGFPVSSEFHKNDVIKLANHAKKNKYKILLSCLSRTTIKDVQAIIDVSQKAGISVGVNLLIGSSKIRRLVEEWDIKEMEKWIRQSIELAKANNLPVEFCTEDTTRTDPKMLKCLYQIAIQHGVKRIWIADTVGIATPSSAKKICNYIKKKIIGAKKIGLDWHGHDDKGLGVANSLIAVENGADRIQATALGIGERAGNTAMEPVLLNLVLAGSKKYNLTKLGKYSEAASKMFNIPIRDSYPAIGKLVHTTAVGMHAAAIYKAKELNRDDLAGLVYSSYNPQLVGRESNIFIGPMSGAANVEWNLDRLHIKKKPELIEKLLDKAKSENRYLTDEDIKVNTHDK